MSMSFASRPVLLAAALVASLVRAADAQDAVTSFENLRQLVKAGDVVTVTDSSGDAVKGRVIDLSPETLKLQSEQAHLEFALADVREISQKQHLKLSTGAAWGFGVAAGFASLRMLPAFNQGCGDCAASMGGAILMTGAMGAAVGAAVAAAVVTTHVVFVNKSSKASVTFAPVVDRDRRGAQVSLRF